MNREFKYYPSDFGALPVKPRHFDLTFDVYDDRTEVHAKFTMNTLTTPLQSLILDAKNMEIKEVTSSTGTLHYSYNAEENKLHIQLEKPIAPNTEFFITTTTITRPTKHHLEGLYYDETPKGAPPTMITQCQQWGFQRLVPCFDDMTAKCTYTTTINADKRYTHLISNGDIEQPRKDLGNDRTSITYNNTKTPMAPYLFFLGCGTYDSYTKECEYADGKIVQLELLVFPGSDKKAAQKALEMLYNAVIWVHLFTGPEKYEHWDEKKQIYEYIIKRDELNLQKKTAALTTIREELKKKTSTLQLGYQYTGEVYREIAMQNSDFGGMENVGNTTITANRIMPFTEMTDLGFEYMIIVKVHEFYHNLNGSEVTGWSPFEIWLNEAVTVHIEKEYFAEMIGNDYERLDTVLVLLNPTGGTYEQDTSTTIMPIEPNGFNDPNELITNVTYSKAPEFVRMIQQTIGEKLFVKGLDLYHRTYKHNNATREQWIQAMEKVSGINLQKMAQTWLKQTGYPTVDICTEYKKKKYTITLQQKGKEDQHWEFPFVVALCDSKGETIASKTHFVQHQKETITFEDVNEPAFVSLARGSSFYGKVQYQQQTQEQLILQALHDKDIVNKYMAFYKLADTEKMNAMQQKPVSEQFKSLYYTLLSNETLSEQMGSLLLAITQSVDDPAFTHKYEQVYQARKTVLKTITQHHQTDILRLYERYSTKKSQGNYVQKELSAIKIRMVKNLCLSLLSLLDTTPIHNIIKKQFEEAMVATDKIVAFKLYLESSAKDKLEVLQTFEEQSRKDLVAWENYLGTIAGNESDDALTIIKQVEQSPSFRIEQANDQRALYVRFSLNKRKSLLTQEGRDFMEHALLKLSKINEYSTGHILDMYGKLDYLDKEHQKPNVAVLMHVLETLDKKKTPSVYNTIQRILKNSPNAVAQYNPVKMMK